MKELNEQKTLIFVGILVAFLHIFIVIPGIPIFLITTVITLNVGLSFLVTLCVCLMMSGYFALNVDKLIKILAL